MKIQIQRLFCSGPSAVWGIALTLGGSNSAVEAAPTPATKTAVSPRATPKKPVKTDYDAEIRAAIGPFFPGARLVAKPFPLSAAIAARLSRESGVKFSGKEDHWQVFDALKASQRVGIGVMTHSTLPGGKDMHIAFAVNTKFAVIGVTPLDAPDNAKMRAFTAQLRGKTVKSAFKVGKDLKTAPGMPQPVAQIGADAVHKGLVILEENFNPQHGANEAAGAAHIESDGHTH